MPQVHMNGGRPSAHRKTSKQPSTSNSPKNIAAKTSYGVKTKAHPIKEDVKIYDDDSDLELTPYIVRKDRLVQEIESTLAEMDDQISSSAKLQEQRIHVEEERNSLLKEIEGTVTEIQNHVLNARELEIEKKAIESECSGLKNQVQDLRKLLGKTTPMENGLDHISFTNGEDSLQYDLDQANFRCQSLEKEVQKLRLSNEKLWLQSKTSKGNSKDSLQKLQQDNTELEKLLQLAEESEDNIARELATCHQSMAEMKEKEDQLQQAVEKTEVALAQSELARVELEKQVKKLLVQVSEGTNSKTSITVVESSQLEAANRDSEALSLALSESEAYCKELELHNKTKQERIEKLEKEVASLKMQAELDAKEIKEVGSKSSTNQGLKPALEKLNKENASLQEALENAEKELGALKVCLEEERSSKNTPEETGDNEAKTNETPKAEKAKKSVFGKGTLTKKSKKKAVKEIEKDEELKDVESLKKDREDLKNECLALSETVTKIANEKREMEKEIEKLEEENKKLVSEINDFKVNIQKLESLKGEKEELDNAHSKIIEMYSDASDRLESVTQKHANATKQLQSLTEEKKTLQNSCKELKESLSLAKKELDSAKKESAARSNEVNLLRKKHEDEKRRLIGLKDGGDKELNRLKEELTQVSKKVSSAVSEMSDTPDNVSNQVEKVVNELKSLKKKHEELENSSKGAERRSKEAEKRIENLEQECASANDMAMEKSVELSRLKRTIEKKIDKLTKENSELRRKLGEMTPKNPASPLNASPVVPEKLQSLEMEPLRVPSPRDVSLYRGQASPKERKYSEPQTSEPHLPGDMRARDRWDISPKERKYSEPRTSEPHFSGDIIRREQVSPKDRNYLEQQPPRDMSMRYQEKNRPKERGHSESQASDQPSQKSENNRQPPPYNMAKRKSLDDVLLRSRQDQRVAPPYKEMGVASPPSSCPTRPQSGSRVVVVAGSVPHYQVGAVVVNREEGYYSLPRDRRRSWGEKKVMTQHGADYDRFKGIVVKKIMSNRFDVQVLQLLLPH
ncbi:A-kinase anchor protein 9 isoform X2 [Nematostella vectensis]|uniref:A-kinase anchor protein 9 isoform X2 n=1 Tax=Nematostella vectensis TaxID=45351 RepID=UPI0013900FBE|nr:A-kinase anchor protein 9 isoform X2 [Nematostella vectensis]